MASLNLTVRRQHLDGSVRLPLSKSISNRALMLHAISKGSIGHGSLSTASDTRVLKGLLEKVDKTNEAVLDAGNAGTVFRFLTPYLAVTPGRWELDGDDRMRQRPVAPLVDALRSLGAEIKYQKEEGHPPLLIQGKNIRGGMLGIDATESSQFASAMMMIAPMLPEGLGIYLFGSPASIPYIKMTISMMHEAGVQVEEDLPAIDIPHSAYGSSQLRNEADWSSAAFWYELMALSKGGSLLLKDLKKDSLQGDRMVVDYFKTLGVSSEFTDDGVMIRKTPVETKEVELNLSHCPDLAPALVVATAALGLPGKFYGLSNLRHKESDRLEALATELRKMGLEPTTADGSLTFGSHSLTVGGTISSHHDHRIAMAFAPLAILGNSLSIGEPAVVDKSYPGFWEELSKLTGI